jgi:hypothetical protein
MRFARLASTDRPETIIETACVNPMSRGSRCEPPNPGRIPSFTSGSPIEVLRWFDAHAVAERERQLGPSAETRPVDRGHGRIGQIRELLEQLLGDLGLGFGFGRVLDAVELLHVRARDELSIFPEARITARGSWSDA